MILLEWNLNLTIYQFCVHTFYVNVINSTLQESSGSNKYYWKIHATFTSLLRKAEEIQLEMPIEVSSPNICYCMHVFTVLGLAFTITYL